jgi:hypothetical protein
MARKQPAEQIAGRFAGIPHAVMDSTAFMGASHHARSLLFELIRQHTGRNNGHFQLARLWLARRGWNSSDMIQHAKAELIDRNLAIKTRLGGLNAGPDLWAVTWLPISDYSGLSEVSPNSYHPGAWHFLDKTIPIPEKPQPEKRDDCTAGRNSAVPPGGTVRPLAVPPGGTVNATFDHSTVPPGGHNEVTNTPRRFVATRVVGKKRSAASAAIEPASPPRDAEQPIDPWQRKGRDAATGKAPRAAMTDSEACNEAADSIADASICDADYWGAALAASQ